MTRTHSYEVGSASLQPMLSKALQPAQQTLLQPKFLQSRIVQTIQSKLLQPVQFRSIQSLHPGSFGTNGTFPVAALEPNSMFAMLVLLFTLAGTGAIYRGSVPRDGASARAGAVPMRGVDAPAEGSGTSSDGPETSSNGPRTSSDQAGTSSDQAGTSAEGTDSSTRGTGTAADVGRTPDRTTETGRKVPGGLDPEFMPPEERILERLHENGGRIYQQELVRTMDRSASTVSRYLTKLESDGRVTRIRDRRQNIVMLPDDEYDWAWEMPPSSPEPALKT